MDAAQTIVVIDDDRGLRTVIELALARTGREIIGFGDGQAALDFLQQAERVDLVISDVAMEGFDGHRLLRHLRGQPATAATHVIFLTASDDIGDRIGGVADKAVERIRAPFDIDELRARVDGALGRVPAAAAVRDAATGLHTRRAFEVLLAEALGATTDEAPVAVIVGLLNGDAAAFPRVAHVVALQLRASDVAARVDDRSFAALHTHCDERRASAIAERVIASVRADPQCAACDLSVGVAVTADPQAAGAADLIGAAHAAARAQAEAPEATIAVRTLRKDAS